MNSSDDDLAALTGLRTQALGRVHEHHACLGSTNDRAWAWFGEGAPHGALVTADAQTHGRGRMGRDWSSPGGAGDIYTSLILRSAVPLHEGGRGFERLAGIALVAAVAVREAIVEVGGLASSRVGLKWPNDVLIDGRKVAGILCEGRISSRGADVVVGIGCNVHRETFADELQPTATSVVAAGGRGDITRAALLIELLDRFEPLLIAYRDAGFAAVRSRYEPHSLVLGRVVDLHEGSGRVRAVIVDALDDAGRLVVRPVDGGESETVASGEVSLRVRG